MMIWSSFLLWLINGLLEINGLIMTLDKHKTRFTEIDLLRFLAAISVMLYHYTFRGAAEGNLSAIGVPSLAMIFKYGYLGVDLFFIISGFVILMTAIDRTPKSFVISRMVRLYPAFWVCCSLTFFMTLFFGGGRYTIKLWEYLVNLTMLQSIFHIKSVDGVYWSLLLEIIFYFYIFALIVFRQLRNIKYYLGVWLVVSIILLKYPVKTIGALFIPEYSAYFIAGSVFYLINREKMDSYKIILLIGSYILALANVAEHIGGMNIMYLGADFNVVVPILFVTVSYSIFLLVALNKTVALRSDWFLLLGALTYPLYLIHQFVGFMIFNALHLHVDRIVLFISTMGLMLLLAYLVHICVEDKFSPVFKRFLERHLWSFELMKK